MIKNFDGLSYKEMFGIITRRILYLIAKLVGSRKYFIYFWYMLVTHGLMVTFAFDTVPPNVIKPMLIVYAIQTIVTLAVIGVLSFNPVDIEIDIAK
jgi:hypothetical protein